MNNEVIKAMNEVDRKPPAIADNFKKWWKKNGYKIARVILFPIWFVLWISDKIEDWEYSRNKWDVGRAKEILDYYVPRYCEYDKRDEAFYFFDNGYGWDYSLAKKHLKRKDRIFWKRNASYGGEMRNYLINEYELEGFTKEVVDISDGRTEINFFLKKGA